MRKVYSVGLFSVTPWINISATLLTPGSGLGYFSLHGDTGDCSKFLKPFEDYKPSTLTITLHYIPTSVPDAWYYKGKLLDYGFRTVQNPLDVEYNQIIFKGITYLAFNHNTFKPCNGRIDFKASDITYELID